MREDIVQFEREEDGRWIAEIPSLPGAMACGETKQEAQSKVQGIVLRVVAAQLDRRLR